MNYYALLLTFGGKNLSAYDPETGQINRIPDVFRTKAKDGAEIMLLMPQYYFTVKRLFSCRQTIEHIYHHFPIKDQPDYRIQVITPTDPGWNEIYVYRNPPLHPGGPPAASEEDLDDLDDRAGKVIYSIETKRFRP
jgi:hypothetical protein